MDKKDEEDATQEQIEKPPKQTGEMWEEDTENRQIRYVERTNREQKEKGKRKRKTDNKKYIENKKARNYLGCAETYGKIRNPLISIIRKKSTRETKEIRKT